MTPVLPPRPSSQAGRPHVTYMQDHKMRHKNVALHTDCDTIQCRLPVRKTRHITPSKFIMSQFSSSQPSYSHSAVLNGAIEPLLKIVQRIDATYSQQLQNIAKQEKELEIKREIEAQNLRQISKQLEEKEKLNKEELEKSRQLLQSERKDFEESLMRTLYC